LVSRLPYQLCNTKSEAVLPAELGIVVNLGKVLDDLVPWSTAHILQNDDGRLVLLDPLQHTSERSSRFPISIDVLLLIIQIRVIDTRGTGDQQLGYQLEADSMV